MKLAWLGYQMLVWKDVKTEVRGKRFLFTTITFGVLLMIVMGVALDGSSRLSPSLATGVLWSCMLFATSVAMNRHDDNDRAMEGCTGLLLAPIDRSLIYYAKWTSATIFTLVTNASMTLVFFILFNQPAPDSWWRLACAISIGSVALAGIGTFLVCLVAASAMRDILVPILMFPISIPLLIALCRITADSWQPHTASATIWVELLVGYIVVFGILPWLLYEPMMEA